MTATRWEYRAKVYGTEAMKLTNAGTDELVMSKHLNSEGSYGWELVSVIEHDDGGCTCFFKRPRE